jgi:hypothetical protein
VVKKGAASGLKVHSRLFLSPSSIEIDKFVLAAFGTPLECPIHPVATGTDPLILQCINQHGFSSSSFKVNN